MRTIKNPGFDFCKPDLKSVFSIFDMIYPDHLDKLLGYLGSLFKLIDSKGLDIRDELKVILKMKYKGGFKWFLRISRPYVNEAGKLCSYTSFVPFDHLNRVEEMSISWTGSTFSNEDFFKEYGLQQNEFVLTRTEMKILELSVTGLSLREIAQKTHTSSSTVKTHFQNMRKKTCSHNKTELHNYFRNHRSHF